MAHLVATSGLAALSSDPFVDFTVTCGTKSWKVHRTTLCGDSPVLMLHCTQMIEAEKRELDIQDADPMAVECMVTYQYLGGYEGLDRKVLLQASCEIGEDEAEQKTEKGCEPGSQGMNRVGSLPPVAPMAPPAPVPPSIWGYSGYGYPPQRGGSEDEIVWVAPMAKAWKAERKRKDVSELNNAGKSAITNLLNLNVSVFELAQRFSIPKLEDYAIERLFSYERYFDKCHLDRILTSIFAVTATDDEKLRYRFFCRCVVNRSFILDDKSAKEVMEANEPLAWKYALEAHEREKEGEKAREKEKRKEQRGHESDIRDLKATLRQKNAMIDELTYRREKMERKLEKERKKARGF